MNIEIALYLASETIGKMLTVLTPLFVGFTLLMIVIILAVKTILFKSDI